MQERFKTIPTLAMLLLVSPVVWAGDEHPPVTISMSLDGDRKYQTIDGFGANINPDQWEHGHLAQAFDWLVDDLGGTLFRFDCYGMADWLDPNRRDEHGHFPAAYLKEVYTSHPYQNAWQALRYLTSKRVKVFLNVSGRIPAGLAEPDGNTLKDLIQKPDATHAGSGFPFFRRQRLLDRGDVRPRARRKAEPRFQGRA